MALPEVLAMMTTALGLIAYVLAFALTRYVMGWYR